MTDQTVEPTYEMPDEEAAKKALESCYGKAEELLGDHDRLEETLQRLEKKLENACPIQKVGEVLAIVPTLISLVRSYVKGEYKLVPVASLIAIVAALTYVVAHFDLIPDFIPGAGLLDDVAVLLFALKLVSSDVEEYKKWREKNGKVLV